MKKFISFILVVGLALPAVAQISPYLEKGKSGFGLSAGPEQGSSFKGYVGALSGSFKGILDLDFTMNADSYDKVKEGLLGDDASSLGLIGTATWWVIRKQPTPLTDLNFGLVAGFESFTFSKYSYIHEMDGNTVDYKGYMGGFFGLESRIKFRMNDSWSLIPGYSVVYDIGNEKRVESNEEFSDSYTGFMSKLGVSLSKRLNKGNVIYIAANQYFDTYETNNYFEITAGFILSQK